jgi:hypothetical protein
MRILSNQSMAPVITSNAISHAVEEGCGFIDTASVSTVCTQRLALKDDTFNRTK